MLVMVVVALYVACVLFAVYTVKVIVQELRSRSKS